MNTNCSVIDLPIRSPKTFENAHELAKVKIQVGTQYLIQLLEKSRTSSSERKAREIAEEPSTASPGGSASRPVALLSSDAPVKPR
jgi:hypothetical protein